MGFRISRLPGYSEAVPKPGGTILTIGSDSHKKEHLGAYIRETMDELAALGFTRHCTYCGMQPVFHDLKEAVNLCCLQMMAGLWPNPVK